MTQTDSSARVEPAIEALEAMDAKRLGEVFQVRTDDPSVPSLVLTVHLRRA